MHIHSHRYVCECMFSELFAVTCADKYAEMCANICAEVCKNMCIKPRIDTHIGNTIDMYMDICTCTVCVPTAIYAEMCTRVCACVETCTHYNRVSGRVSLPVYRDVSISVWTCTGTTTPRFFREMAASASPPRSTFRQFHGIQMFVDMSRDMGIKIPLVGTVYQ